MIRKATAADFDFIYNLYMHPDINPYLLYEQMSEEEFIPVFDELLMKGVKYVYMVDGIPAGMCKLIPLAHRTSHVVYLGGVAIHPSFAGRGHGKKMLEEALDMVRSKGILRVELSTATTNEKAIRLYQQLGFEEEGRLRKYSFAEQEDRFLDEILMARLF